MKVDVVVEETHKAIEEGKCVVIGLQNTGEVCQIATSCGIPYICPFSAFLRSVWHINLRLN